MEKPATYVLYLEDGGSTFLQITHTTRCHVPEDREHDTVHCENVRSDDVTDILHCAQVLIFPSFPRSVPTKKLSCDNGNRD